jgi:hypothetical protein
MILTIGDLHLQEKAPKYQQTTEFLSVQLNQIQNILKESLNLESR